MKILVNYDLLDKIRESKKGISLQRSSNYIIKYTLLFGSCDVIFGLINNASSREAVLSIISTLGLNMIIVNALELMFSPLNKNIAINDLKLLVNDLRNQYVNTNYELLQKAYKYDTSYSFMLDENKIPHLKQEKFIMVPVIERDEEKEVSLVQEHVIGSNEYILSYGSPKKVLKPVLKPA